MSEPLELGAGDVLVLRALGLGDALTSVAALRGVRRAWPGRRVVLAGPAGLGAWLEDLGLVDAVIPATGLGTPLAVAGSGHVAVNLHGRGSQSHRLLQATRPGSLVAFACAEAGHPSARAGHQVAPPWRADEHEVHRWCRLVRTAGGPCGPEDLRIGVAAADNLAPSGGPVLLHPGAASASRRWPVERWRELSRRLTAAGQHVAVTGSAEERDLARAVLDGAAGPGTARSLAGELSLPRLAETLAGARLLVCGDTGVAHVATAVGTPSVLLFGPTPPARWGPAVDEALHAVLWHGDGAGDPHGDRLDPALGRITVEEVAAAAETLLGAVTPAGR